MNLLEKDEYNLPLNIYNLMSKNARKNVDTSKFLED